MKRYAIPLMLCLVFALSAGAVSLGTKPGGSSVIMVQPQCAAADPLEQLRNDFGSPRARPQWAMARSFVAPRSFAAQLPSAPAPASTPSEWKSEMLVIFIKYALVPLVLALAGLAIAALRRLSAKWAADAAAARARGESDLKLSILSKLAHFGELTAQDLENNEKAQLEAAAADGKLDAAELKGLKNTAVSRVGVMLGTEGIAEAKEVLGVDDAGLGHLISGAIEKGVSIVSARSATEDAVKSGVPIQVISNIISPAIAAEAAKAGAAAAAAVGDKDAATALFKAGPQP